MTECDNWNGACACGAWHKLEDFDLNGKIIGSAYQKLSSDFYPDFLYALGKADGIKQGQAAYDLIKGQAASIQTKHDRWREQARDAQAEIEELKRRLIAFSEKCEDNLAIARDFQQQAEVARTKLARYEDEHSCGDDCTESAYRGARKRAEAAEAELAEQKTIVRDLLDGNDQHLKEITQLKAQLASERKMHERTINDLNQAETALLLAVDALNDINRFAEFCAATPNKASKALAQIRAIKDNNE